THQNTTLPVSKRNAPHNDERFLFWHRIKAEKGTCMGAFSRFLRISLSMIFLFHKKSPCSSFVRAGLLSYISYFVV
ncbi:MAG: hypothetical protein IIX11_06310, partial [Selenomonadales bacterium]|nr:hypothetical protein [Selenomonadales bacterium]